MSHDCQECGKEFETERGLHIHQSQMHEDSETNQQENQKEGKTEGDKQISKTENNNLTDKIDFEPDKLVLGISEVAAIFFILGIGIGFAAGVFAPLQDSINTNAVNAGNQESGNDDRQLPIAEDTVNVSNVNIEGEPMLGDQDAPVTLVMYEDFQCPFCQRFENNAFQQVESDYVESGKVRVVWKDFPLPQLGHNWAEPASSVMECVYRRDESAFWEIKDKVFDNQRTLTEQNVQSKIVSWAGEEGVAESEVQNCIENGNPMDEVNQDKKDGSSLEATLNGKRFVGGTPSFVVYGDEEGTALSGALPYQIVQRVLEKELQDSQ